MHTLGKVLSGMAVIAGLGTGAATAAGEDDLLMRALGTTEGLNPVVAETFRRAAMPLSEADRELALKCWKENVCETGHGDVVVAMADGFGENVWRQITHMEFVMQALTYPEVSKIIYTTARGDATQAIADMRSLVAQGVDVIVTFPDAGEALLPTVREATEAGITVVPYISAVGGTAGEDYLGLVAEDLCDLGKQFVGYIADNHSGEAAKVVELGGTPGNGLSATWQKCAEDAAPAANVEILGKADTNWTQEGTFEAMSGFLSQHDDINGVMYEYADGFRGALRAYESMGQPIDLTLTLRTDEQGLFCDWEAMNDPNFKIFYSSGGSFQSRIALTAAMMKRAGEDVPTLVNVPFKMKQVVAGVCNKDFPEEMPVSSAVDPEMLGKMFPSS